MKVRLSELISRVKIPIKILDKEEYSLVTIRMNNKGIKLREKKSGALIGTKSLYEVRKGQFALSGIDARNGAYGIVPDELNGAVVSNDFWTHEINEKKVDRNFFSILISTDKFLLRCQKASEGTTNRQRLQANVFYNLEFDIPSLSEQKIFAKKILDGKETTSKFFEELSTQQTLITQLRQSILQEAVQGKLVPPLLFSPSKGESRKAAGGLAVEPASELLKRIKAEKEKLIKQGKLKKEKPLPPISENEIPYQLPEGWVWCRLGEIVLNSEAGKSFTAERYPAKFPEWGVIKVSAMSWDVFLEEENKTLLKSSELNLAHKINEGDYLISRANTDELIGKSVIVGKIKSNLLLSDKSIRMLFSSLVDKSYVNLFNNSSIARVYYKKVASGTSDSMKNITREQMYQLPIPLPPLPEQKRIVEKVNQLMQHCHELEQQVQQSITHAQQLMQAVLREVFEGKKEYKINEVVGMAAEK